MTIGVTLSPLAPPVPGQAILNIRGWEESSVALEFAIQRGRDEFYLQEGEQWSGNPFWFKVDHFDSASDNLQLVVGKNIVDPLLGASSEGALQFKLRLQDGSVEEEQTMRLRDGLLTSLAGAEQGGYTTSVAGGQLQQSVVTSPPLVTSVETTSPQPDLSISPPVQDPIPVPDPIPVTPQAVVVPTKNTPAWLLPLLLLLLIAIVAGGWFFLNKGKNTSIPVGSTSESTSSILEGNKTSGAEQTEMPQAESSPTTLPATEAGDAVTTTGKPESPEPKQTDSAAAESAPNDSVPTAVAPCSSTNMDSMSELMFVQGCVKSVPSSAEMLKTIEAAKASKHCGIAQRLYAHRGQSGDVKVATAYAHEYDPKYHQPSDCFKAPDAATAAYWYETILGQEPDNAEAKQRFEELKP